MNVKEPIDAVVATIDKYLALLIKIIDANTILLSLLILSLTVGVGVLYLQNLILEQCLIPHIQEQLK
ncbi:MAG: hypothetical protein JGK17_30865 [Microcoleus sp. PH2017_10_PVI_O_A]|uniref:hypothetical protein n=1 Tax=unclassified Microcoleus TaxID=2642155 RepID=UPI001E016ED6|nr:MULTISPECIES: hypothetical protein [unclassified Microcoleus]TAE78795.1 MAG: hypothetical protein EAZ83_23930 [Oscillatoriales cyanobacterium]MCC3409866.1 hypothetical protein [Microcoleus sp. PH2017_10_PVI_O_A]MCC3460002.1 hypothetical protein [Microcoleus sp. PH2017_11_PCY_U_A]MCC3482465.1 hypothetical protein [Microcoleus sp. PH2017_12_PCY_D_A]MCC3531105.1 hypothetical protein [Microcoleus sp. PH2017_21_RUC_O_A]